MTTAVNAAVGRRKLRSALRRAREASGQTQEQVARAMDWSLSKLIRIEAGGVGVSTNDLKALLQLYDINDNGQVQTLVELARASRSKPWWITYKDSLNPGYMRYLGLEAGASSMRSFQAIAIPGLFQTEEYAAAASADIWIGQPLSAHEVQELVTVRMIRQREVLGRPDPPELCVVIDEAALRHIVGDRQVMRAQLHHLTTLAGRPDITIHVVPFTAGVPLSLSSFVIFGFPDEDDTDVVYLEGAIDHVLIDEPPQILQYGLAFERLRQKALSPADSLTMIRSVAGELR